MSCTEALFWANAKSLGLGSRSRSLGIRGTADLLDNRFRLVWKGRRTALPRHQTLNSMLDWSYNLLTEPEKETLSRLSVFVGAFSIKSACEVATEAELDDERVTDAITSLLAKSLISKSPSGDFRPDYIVF